MPRLKLYLTVALAALALGACKEEKPNTKDELQYGKYRPEKKREKLKPLLRLECKQLGKLKTWRYSPALAVLADGKVMVSGGRQFDGRDWFNSVEILDPATGEATPGKPMRVPRAMHGVIKLGDGRLLIYGGMVQEIELYDPKRKSWRVVGKLKAEAHGVIATPMKDGRVYVAGGDPMRGASYADEAYTWDPAKLRLTKAKPLSVGIIGEGFLAKDGTLVAYARNFDETKRRLYSIDPQTGAVDDYKPEGLLFKALKELSRTPTGEKAYLVRGPDSTPISPPTALSGKTLLRFFPSRMAWRTLGKLKLDHQDGTAVALSPEKLVVLGGRDEINAAVELCAPKKGS